MKKLVLLFCLAPSVFAASADLSIGATTSTRAEAPGRDVSLMFDVHNLGPDAAENVVLTIPLPPEGDVQYEVRFPDMTCERTASALVCRDAAMAKGELQRVTVRITAPRQSNGLTFPLEATARSSTPDPAFHALYTEIRFPRTIYVDGAGRTLTLAIEEANALCTGPFDCWIGFDVPRPFVIEPAGEPLPPITARNLVIDGEGVTLRGRRLERGDGLRFQAADVRVRNLTVVEFPGNGVVITAASGIQLADLRNCRIDANRLRGVVVDAPRAPVGIGASLVNSNGHSGVYVLDANIVDVHLSDISGNGASGMFLARGRASLASSKVTHNRHWGVSLLPGALVAIGFGTVLHANNGQPVDYHLDGPTLPDGPERDLAPNRPEITEAFFDPVANRTIVRAVVRGGRIYRNLTARLYLGDVEEEVASSGNTAEVNGETHIEWQVLRDLRGQKITAIASQIEFADGIFWWSSEAAAPVVVR